MSLLVHGNGSQATNVVSSRGGPSPPSPQTMPSSQSQPFTYSSNASQETNLTNDTDRVFTPQGSDSGSSVAAGNGDASSQDSQLLQLSQLAAAQEKMLSGDEGAVGAFSRKRMADGMVKHTRDSSSTSPVRMHGHSRNTSTVSMASNTTTGSRMSEVSCSTTKHSLAFKTASNIHATLAFGRAQSQAIICHGQGQPWLANTYHRGGGVPCITGCVAHIQHLDSAWPPWGICKSSSPSCCGTSRFQQRRRKSCRPTTTTTRTYIRILLARQQCSSKSRICFSANFANTYSGSSCHDSTSSVWPPQFTPQFEPQVLPSLPLPLAPCLASHASTAQPASEHTGNTDDEDASDRSHSVFTTPKHAGTGGVGDARIYEQPWKLVKFETYIPFVSFQERTLRQPENCPTHLPSRPRERAWQSRAKGAANWASADSGVASETCRFREVAY